MPSEKQYEEINNNCENLKLEIGEKNKIIKRTEVENKELKMKLDNLVEQIKNMREVIKRKTDEIENMKMNIESLKEEMSFNNKKLNSLELQNKKLNIEYENLNKDHQILKNEKEKMHQELEDYKVTIFNYRKELSINNQKKNKFNNKYDYDYNSLNRNNLYNKKQEFLNDNLNEIVNNENNYNDEIINNENIFRKENSNENLYKYEDKKYYNLRKENYSVKTGGIRKTNYSNFDLENFKSSKKPINSLPELESRLSYLISEKRKFENELLKMPEHPRNLNEIKIKKEFNNKISEIEQDINLTRSKIRNYNY